MPKPIRTFIAAQMDITAPLRPILDRLGAMGRAVKPVSTDGLHVTLKFLGQTELEQTAEISRIMQDVARTKPPCEPRLVGLGAFPHTRRPSVVWAGLDGAETLSAMAEELETRLTRVGFKPEKRRFHPHLTLARIKSKPPDDLATLLAEHEATDFGTAAVESIELFQSEMTPQGARYTVLATGELQGEETDS